MYLYVLYIRFFHVLRVLNKAYNKKKIVDIYITKTHFSLQNFTEE